VGRPGAAWWIFTCLPTATTQCLSVFNFQTPVPRPAVLLEAVHANPLYLRYRVVRTQECVTCPERRVIEASRDGAKATGLDVQALCLSESVLLST